MLFYLLVNCLVQRNSGKQFFGCSLAMMEFVVAAQLRFEICAFCPSAFDSKFCHFGQPFDIFLVDNHTKVYRQFTGKAGINSLNNFIESSSATFQKPTFIVHTSFAIEGYLYFANAGLF